MRYLDKDFTAYQAHRKDLIALVNALDEEIGMDVVNRVIILNRLDSTKKITKFSRWARSQFENGVLQASEGEIIQAALQISREI